MKDLLAQFQNLNPKDPGVWPPLPKAVALLALFAILIAAGAYFDWLDQWDNKEKLAAEETKLKDEYKTKKAKAVNKDIYEQQKREIDSSFEALRRQLPERSEMDALLLEINQAGLGRGLQFELFKPAATEKMQGVFAELPITLKINGTYHDIGQFASDVSQLSRIVTLNDLSLAANKDSITMDATAKTFRYLSDDEQAKSAAKAPRGKAAKGEKAAKADKK